MNQELHTKTAGITMEDLMIAGEAAARTGGSQFHRDWKRRTRDRLIRQALTEGMTKTLVARLVKLSETTVHKIAHSA